MTIESRATNYLSGKGKAVMPKRDLYISAAYHARLQTANRAGYLTIPEWEKARAREADEWFKKFFKENGVKHEYRIAT